MLPDRVSNPGPLTYESGALPIALRGPAGLEIIIIIILLVAVVDWSIFLLTCTQIMLPRHARGIPSKHAKMGPIWAESGHSAQIGPIRVRHSNFSPINIVIKLQN